MFRRTALWLPALFGFVFLTGFTAADRGPVSGDRRTPHSSPAADTATDHGAVSLGPGQGVAMPGLPPGCIAPGSYLMQNYDGGAENAYQWTGVWDPPFNVGKPGGAFAECYVSPSPNGCTVVGFQFWVTSKGPYIPPLPLHYSVAYVWADAGGIPGAALRQMNFTPYVVSQWPSIAEVTVCLSLASYLYIPPGQHFWVGCKDTGTPPAGSFALAADLNGFGGCPYTYVWGPGVIKGWASVGPIFGPTQAMGIGVWVK